MNKNRAKTLVGLIHSAKEKFSCLIVTRCLMGAIGSVALLALAAPVSAQLIRPPSPSVSQDKLERQEMNRREAGLRSPGPLPDTPDPKKLAEIRSRIEEDFQRMLIRHNELARAIASPNKLDYNLVSVAVEEIKKRATRIRATLQLNGGDDSKTVQPIQLPAQASNSTEFKDSLVVLCKNIKSFVTNPVIENPGTVNSQQLAKARHDLESIIEVSGSVKKSAGTLGKGSSK